MAAARALRGAFEGIVADSLDRLREELVARHEELLREFLSERAQPPEPRAAAAPAEEELSAAPAECGGDAQEQPPSEPSTRRPRTSGGAATGKYFRPPARSPASSPTPSPRGAGDELQTQRRHAAEHISGFDAASGESSGGLAEAAGGADTPGASPVPRLSRSGSVLIRTQGRHQTKNMFEPAISHESDNGRVEAGGGADAPVLALASLEEHRVFREARLRRVETTDSFWKTTLLDDLDESTRKCVTQSRDLFRRKLRVGDMLVDRHRCQGLIQHPNSRYRLAWDLTGFLFIIYDLFVIPLYVFDLPDEGWAEVALMWVSVSFWTVDIFVSFCTGYYIDGFLEMRPSRIARRYLRSWFGPDVAIVLMDWAFVVVGLGDAAGILRIRRSLRALRIIRALRLVRLAKIREIFTKITDGINSEFVRGGGLILLSILKLVVSVVILNHYIACVWYALSGVQLSDSRQCSWVAKHGVDDASNTYKYLTSLGRRTGR
ncbi:unnamed protein product [Prorocentrum cordatum]|uniref:Ion transport domain-containing protein n=1 Tax=Prorocentrum cordatum TaxID=2364126 RepID=A0ABN9RVI9_9DINO|nr:unnamed protein product [Polarella glacialis]